MTDRWVETRVIGQTVGALGQAQLVEQPALLDLGAFAGGVETDQGTALLTLAGTTILTTLPFAEFVRRRAPEGWRIPVAPKGDG
jgi:hypothetical protein